MDPETPRDRARLMSETLNALRDQLEEHLAANLPSGEALSPRLLQAMRYSTLAGGKRIRPLLTLATAACVGGGDSTNAVVPACALEYIHTYSLIHDDLPGMDNDVLRRGKPTCHVAFDEATAILAGCGLLTHAFHLLANAPGLATDVRLAIVTATADAAGAKGMLAGQSVDLLNTGGASSNLAQLDEPQLQALHAAKTGALIRAAVRVGALAGGCSSSAKLLAQLDDFACCIGLGFQVADDLLNVTSDASRLGKAVGSDAALGKNTYPALLGIDGTRAKLAVLHEQAMQAIADLGSAAEPLRDIARQLRDRDH